MNEHFTDVAQFRELNKLLRLDSHKDEIKDLDLFGARRRLGNDEFSVIVQGGADFRFTASTHRLLVALLEELGKHSRQEIRLTVDTFMERCGLLNRSETRKQLKIDLQSLIALRVDLTTKNGELLRECVIFECAELRSNGLIYARLSEEALGRWKETLGLMQLPRLYFTLNRKQYQAAPAILYYIALMRHISNKSGRHKDVLRIESLLSVTTLPSVEEVRRTKNGGIKERIVDRFFRELHALDSELKFQFQRNGKSISEKAVRNLRFEDLLDVCVCIEWVHEDQLRGNGKPVAARFHPTNAQAG